MSSTDDRGYARPDILVTTEWLASHLDDPTLRIVVQCIRGNGDREVLARMRAWLPWIRTRPEP